MRLQLSTNFYLDEFTRSQTAARFGIDNTPPQKTRQQLARLCTQLLQPIRNEVGPIHISSGYRSPALNKKIGGSANSQHTLGLAADITATGKTPYQLAACIHARGGYDQLILEFGEWVHVSLPKKYDIARGEILTAVKVPRPFRKPKTVYVPGLLSQEDALKIALKKSQGGAA